MASNVISAGSSDSTKLDASNVKLLKPDPHGIMETVFMHYASPVVDRADDTVLGFVALSRFGFLLFSADCGLQHSENAPAAAPQHTDIWEELCNVDLALRENLPVEKIKSESNDPHTSYSAKFNDAMTFRVFPTLLSQLAIRISGGDEKNARQLFMKSYIMPLYRRIQDGSAVRAPLPNLPATLIPMPKTTDEEQEDASIASDAASDRVNETPIDTPSTVTTRSAAESKTNATQKPETDHSQANPAPTDRSVSRPVLRPYSLGEQPKSSSAARPPHVQKPAPPPPIVVQRHAAQQPQQVARPTSPSRTFMAPTASSTRKESPPRGAKVARGAGMPANRVLAAAPSLRGRASSRGSQERAPSRSRSVSIAPEEVEAKWSEFLSRQEALGHARQNRIQALHEQLTNEELGILSPGQKARQPALSIGTKKILEEIGRRPMSRSPRSKAALEARLPASAGRDEGPSFTSTSIGDALHQNAATRAARLAKLVSEREAEATRLRSSKKASAKSEELLRQRLGREIAACCVYIAAQRQAAYKASSEPIHPTIALMPWWLLPLSPCEVLMVLCQTGFLTNQLEPEQLEAAMAITQRWADPAAPKDSIPDATSVNTLLFAHFWHALTFRRGALMAQQPVPSVLILALLQALVTGGYDVRLPMLEAAATAIGLAHPFLTVGVQDGKTSATARSTKSQITPAVARDAAEAMPPAFAAAIHEHINKLKDMALSHQLEATLADDLHRTDGSGSTGLTPEAVEVLEGRVVWPVSLLKPLKVLYTNRIAFLRKLAGAGSSHLTAAAELVVEDESAQLPVAQFAADARQERKTAEGADFTFMPMLCKKSLQLAAQRSDTSIPREELLLQFGAQVEARRRAKRAAMDGREADECTFRPDLSATQSSKEGRGSRAAVSRFELLYQQAQFKAQQRAIRAAETAAIRHMQEVAECTFRPRVNEAPSEARTVSSDLPGEEREPVQVGGAVPRTGGSSDRLFSSPIKDPSAFASLRDPWTPVSQGVPKPRVVSPREVVHHHEPASVADLRGFDAYAARMRRSQAEKETKRKLEEALAQGYLHLLKPAILDPGQPSQRTTQRRASRDEKDRNPAHTNDEWEYTEPSLHQNTQHLEEPVAPLGPPPLLYVDVAVTPSITERIPLWAESDCELVAHAFAQKHGLTAHMTAKLAKLLASQRAAVVEGNRP